MGCGSSVNTSGREKLIQNENNNNNHFAAKPQPIRQPPQPQALPPQGAMYHPPAQQNIPPPPYTPNPPRQQPSAPVAEESTQEHVEVDASQQQEREVVDGDTRLTRDILNEFVELDKQIHELEEGGVEEKYMMLSLEHKNLQEALRLTKHDFDMIKQQSLNEYQQNVNDPANNGEEMKIKNREHVVQTQLFNLSVQVTTKKTSLEEAKQEYERLNDLRLKVDGLLENIFNGAYGSEREDELELEATQLLECKQKISLSHHKWWNARQLVYHSCTQISYSVKRWEQVGQVPAHNHEVKYTLVTDTYNNLVACHQNFRRAHEYLQLDLPYWSVDDDKELVNSINLIYNDVATDAGQKKAAGWFKYYYWRFALLINWLDQVINKKLVVEYRDVAKKFKEKYRELKIERLRCIKEKVREVLGDELDVNNLASDSSSSNEVVDELPSVTSDIAFTLPESFAKESQTATEGLPEVVDTGTDPTSVEAVVNEIRKSEETNQQTEDASVGVSSSVGTDAGIGTDAPMMAETGIGTEVSTQDSGIGTDTAVGNDAGVGTETATSTDVGVGGDMSVGTDMGVGTDAGMSSEIGVGTDAAEHKPPTIRFVPLEELAPTPSDNELFGDISSLREKHAQEIEELKKVQEQSKYSQETNLQEKLRRRQSRRRKLQLDEAQREEIASRLSGRIEEETVVN